jgi:hypothetical protein
VIFVVVVIGSTFHVRWLGHLAPIAVAIRVLPKLKELPEWTWFRHVPEAMSVSMMIS